MSLDQVGENSNYGFEAMPLTAEEAKTRIDYLCEFFKTISTMQKHSKKKRPAEDLNFDERGQIKPVSSHKKPKSSKFVVPRDEQGEIVYPFYINNTHTKHTQHKIGRAHV